MATFYWVGGAGTLNNVSTANLSTSSGGASGAGPLTASDTLIIDASSGAGTITLGADVSMFAWDSSASGLRAIAFAGFKIMITGNAGTVFNHGSGNNIYYTGTPRVEFTYSGSTGTRTIANYGGSSTGYGFSTFVTAGTDTVVVTGRGLTLDFTGFAGTLSSGARSLEGSLVLGAGMTCGAGSNTTTFNGAGSITSNGVAFNSHITVAGTGTITLADAVNCGSRWFYCFSGNFNSNGFNITCGNFYADTTTTRTVTLGTSTVTCSAAGTGAFWAASTGLTLSAASATVILTSSGAKTMYGGGHTYGTITQGGVGRLTFENSLTVGTLNNSAIGYVRFAVSVTFTILTSLALNGSAISQMALYTPSSGTRSTISMASGTVDLSYATITDLAATGGATFNALASNGCVNGGNNTGWNFGISGTPAANFFHGV